MDTRHLNFRKEARQMLLIWYCMNVSLKIYQCVSIVCLTQNLIHSKSLTPWFTWTRMLPFHENYSAALTHHRLRCNGLVSVSLVPQSLRRRRNVSLQRNLEGQATQSRPHHQYPWQPCCPQGLAHLHLSSQQRGQGLGQLWCP